MRERLEALCQGQDMTREESAELFGRMVRGELSDIEITAATIALKAKGEKPEEIAGAAQALREAAAPFPKPDYDYADTCGTGGDGAHSVNISTAVAFVAAELGIPVAKHGNRSVSSRCGSADVLEECGVKLDPSPEVARRCLDEVGICFLMAPQYHAGIRHVMPMRRTLGTRTIFNLLGPLVNPAEPPLQVMGVYAPEYCEPAARTLGLLGAKAALVVHGSGLDEIALHGPTTAALWRDGKLTTLELDPGQCGFGHYPKDALAGGSPEENGRWLRVLLSGKSYNAAHVTAVAMNAGALYWIAGHAETFQEGAHAALLALKSGRARARLEALAELSHVGS